MSNAKIDENDVKTWLAYNETTGLVEPLRVDPIFGYLEVFNVANTGSATGTEQIARIDENDAKTKLGYNETSGLIEALRCDSNGNLITILQ